MANIKERAEDKWRADCGDLLAWEILVGFATSEIEPYRTALAELVEALEGFDSFKSLRAAAAAKKLLEADNE